MKSEETVISDGLYVQAMKLDEAAHITAAVFTAYMAHVGGGYPMMIKDNATQLADAIIAFRSRLLRPRAELMGWDRE